MASRPERKLRTQTRPTNPALTSSAATLPQPADDEFQAQMLQGVSRTFALTIPQLPPALTRVVANAYLLCRIVDTIEDEPALSTEQKQKFYRQFFQVLNQEQNAESFAQQLGPCLSPATIAAEHELIYRVPRVIGITRSFPLPQRRALERCVRVMARGMAEFQAREKLISLKDLDQYCYYVAGVVGQMLTRLFCLYSSEINKNHHQLMTLAVSFGQGLQMTNILKDVWEDYRRGFCWLPEEVFAIEGCELHQSMKLGTDDGFRRGIQRLVAVAHDHLRNALTYTLLMPRHETGIRKFCLWAIGFALLTLRKITRHLDYTDGSQVKISRLSVKATILLSQFSARHDRVLNGLFSIAANGLPCSPASTR